MEKILTIFDRDWDGNRGVVDQYIEPLRKLGSEEFGIRNPSDYLRRRYFATEKLDGTNVRLTVRNETLVRLEKRRNPSKVQKKQGITQPWYVDADEYGPEDKYLWEAAKNTGLTGVEDGEWSGEAVGPKIQGNPLNLEQHTVILFSHILVRADRLMFDDVPTDFEGLREWLPQQKSKIGKDCGIEGIVWWSRRTGLPEFKIKQKDFK